MKYIISLLALCLTFHLSAQADLSQIQDRINDFARFCASHDWQGQMTESNYRVEKTHKLDSVVNFDGAGTYIGKTELTYDNQLRTSLLHFYDLDSAGTTVLLQGVFTFEYGSIDLPSRILSDSYNPETQQLERATEFDFYYDGMQRVDSFVLHSIDPFSGQFIPLSAGKQVYTGNLLTQNRQWFFFSLFGFWVPASTTNYQYDVQDRLIQQETSIVDIFTMEESLSDQTTYTYNSEGLRDTITDFIWTGIAWEPTQRFIAQYFGNGTPSSEVRQIFSNGEWINNVWNTYHVEEPTETYPYTSYIWDPVDGAWQKTDSVVNLLNPALPFENVVVPTELSVLDAIGGVEDSGFLVEGPSIDETQYFFMDTLSKDFLYTGNDVYHYSLLEGSGISQVLPDFISVAPNPAQEQFTIELALEDKATFRIYNNTGILVGAGQLIRGENEVHTGSWLPGMYYVVIHVADGSMYIHKQMVE